MVALSKGRKKWQRKARTLKLTCHCWPCLRAQGITPHANANMEHRTDVLNNIYNTHDGKIQGKTG